MSDPGRWIELAFWAVAPSLLILFGLVLSLVLAFRIRRLSQFLFFVPALFLGAAALFLLYQMWVLGAWPTFVPYILTGIMSLVVCAQILWYLIRRKGY